jgi:hypothetical protein
VSMWIGNIIQSLLFVLHHPVTLCSGLLNRLNKQEVRVTNVRNALNVAYVFVPKQLSPEARQAITKVQEKCLTVSTTDCRPNVHGTEDLLR